MKKYFLILFCLFFINSYSQISESFSTGLPGSYTTGTVTLSFIEEFARFEDFISDHFKPDEDYCSQFE